MKEDYIHEYLKRMANRAPGEVWTERHWQEANTMLFSYEVDHGYISDQELAERLGGDNYEEQEKQ